MAASDRDSRQRRGDAIFAPIAVARASSAITEQIRAAMGIGSAQVNVLVLAPSSCWVSVMDADSQPIVESVNEI